MNVRQTYDICALLIVSASERKFKTGFELVLNMFKNLLAIRLGNGKWSYVQYAVALQLCHDRYQTRKGRNQSQTDRRWTGAKRTAVWDQGMWCQQWSLLSSAQGKSTLSYCTLLKTFKCIPCCNIAHLGNTLSVSVCLGALNWHVKKKRKRRKVLASAWIAGLSYYTMGMWPCDKRSSSP